MLILDEKKVNFSYNDLDIQRVIAYFTVGLNKLYFKMMGDLGLAWYRLIAFDSV